MSLQPVSSDARSAAMARVVSRLAALTSQELAADVSRIDLSVCLIDAGIGICEADPGSRIVLAQSLMRLARALDADALTAGHA